MRLVFAVLLAFACAPAMAQSVIPDRDIIDGAIDGYIRPAFAQFADEASSLEGTIATLCATPSPDALGLSQNQFRSTIIGWSRVEFLRIGPLGMGDRIERLMFWPDRKGIALRQVQAALAEMDVTVTASGTLARKSVAMQGLVALEYLLFGTGAETLGSAEGAHRCAYAHASGQLVADRAAILDSEWKDVTASGVTASLLDPKPGAADYRTAVEVLEKLAATMIHGTEAIRDQRLAPVVSEATGVPKPRSALFWRSGMTIPALAANFSGLGAFFAAARFPEAIGPDNEWIAKGAAFEFQNAARATALVTAPMEQAVGDPRQLQALKYLVIVTRSLDTLLGQDLAAALGLSVGFSTLDGD